MLSLKKTSHDDNTHCRVTIIPDSSFSYTAAFAYFSPAAYQQQPFSLSLSLSSLPPTPLTILLPPPFLSLSVLFLSALSPASANPTIQILHPQNLIEAIWLPINGTDRVKLPGQCVNVPIMVNTSHMYEEAHGAAGCFMTDTRGGKRRRGILHPRCDVKMWCHLLFVFLVRT